MDMRGVPTTSQLLAPGQSPAEYDGGLSTLLLYPYSESRDRLRIAPTVSQAPFQQAAVRKDALDGYTPFQATKRMLDDNGVFHHVLWDPETPKKPMGLSWGGTDWPNRMWKSHPQVQMYDNTHRTNDKGLALLQVLGIQWDLLLYQF
ncbi:hypothetical protein V8F33_011837 [Rhypophila sp. PSN 637]